MRKKRIMVIGAAGCGKSALARALEGPGTALRGAAMPVYGARTIVCPGAYIENVHMYRHLIALAQDASCVLAVLRAAGGPSRYSPGFLRALGRPSAGVVTGTSLALEEEASCQNALRLAGVEGPIFSVNPLEDASLEELEAYLLPFGQEKTF